MIYLIIFIALFILEILYLKIARALHITDNPNIRSTHKKKTIRGGGIIFFFAILIYAGAFGIDGYYWFLTGLTVVSLVSFADDIRSLGPLVRFVIQLLGVILLLRQFDMLAFDHWIFCLSAILLGTGFLNAYNFMDGINGMTGACSLGALVPLVFLNREIGFIPMPLLYVTGLSLLVFCFFNFRKKALCFAGDVGAITIGFIMLFILAALMIKTGEYYYFVFFALYGADAGLTTFHRFLRHENIVCPHRRFVFHLLVHELKFPQLTVALIYMTLQLVISFGLLFLPVNGYLYMGIVVVLLILGFWLFIRRYFHLHLEYLRRVEAEKNRETAGNLS